MKLFGFLCVYRGVKRFVPLLLPLVLAIAVLARAEAPAAGVGAGALATVAEAEARLALVDGEGVRSKAVALLFVGDDCPISNALMPEVNRIIEKYGPSGVAFYFVYPDRDLSADAALRHAKDFSLRAPVIVDRDGTLAVKAGAKVTPEAVVFGARAQVIYRGRINDLYAGIGQRREAPVSNDLRDALEAVIAGKNPNPAWPRAVGCFIPAK